MKNFRKLSALILSALASFTLLVGCGAAPVEDTTPAESAPVVEETAPETTPEDHFPVTGFIVSAQFRFQHNI